MPKFYIWDECSGTESDDPTDHELFDSKLDDPEYAAEEYIDCQDEIGEGSTDVWICPEDKTDEVRKFEVHSELRFYHSATEIT